MPEEDAFVLVVEDNASVREAVCGLLEDEGWRTFGVRDGQEALRALDEGPVPCLILLDLMMPVMDGFEFRNRQLLDERIADVPVVIMTAAMPPSLDLPPVQAVLAKPIDPVELIDTVDDCCRKAGCVG